jgi:hypothetical protein
MLACGSVASFAPLKVGHHMYDAGKTALSKPAAVKSGSRYHLQVRRITANVLRLASVPVGIVIGLWTAELQSLQTCPPYMRCPTLTTLVPLPTFATWQCALFGLGAAVLLVLASETVARPRSPSWARPPQPA